MPTCLTDAEASNKNPVNDALVADTLSVTSIAEVRTPAEVESSTVVSQSPPASAPVDNRASVSENAIEDSDGRASEGERSEGDGGSDGTGDSSDSETTDEELAAGASPHMSSLAGLDEFPVEPTASADAANVATTSAVGIEPGEEGHACNTGSVSPIVPLLSSTCPTKNLPPRTGIQIPMLEETPAFIRAVPPLPEPLYTAPKTLFDDIARRETDRISHPEFVQNRTVYDSAEASEENTTKACPLRHSASPPGTNLKEELAPYYKLTSSEDVTLVFESRFESGNLRRAVQVYDFEYDLIVNPDFHTKVHTQWYLFRVSNTRVGPAYRFNIINMVKPTSVYNEGMRPLIYSCKAASERGVGWVRGGESIAYYQNGIRRSKDQSATGDKIQSYFTLTFTIAFEHDADMVYFCHCYPYTYTDLQKDLQAFEADPAVAKHFRRRKLCDTLAGNACDLVTVTSFNSDPAALRSRRAVVITARVHPGESNASWIMKGILDYLTGTSLDARILRDNFVFKVVPMLNPDGVIVGNYRCSLSGTDLNRQWSDPSRRVHPTIFFTKSMIRHLMLDREVVLYIDIHGHSRKKNVFMYGNSECPGIREKIFPRLLSKSSDCFNFDDCCFKIQKNKESTARVVVYHEFMIVNSFTLEASFCGADFGALADQHFTTRHLEELGYMVCDAILDFCDPDQSKVSMICKELQFLFPDDGNSDDVSDSDVEDAEQARRRRKKGKKKEKEKSKKKRVRSKKEIQAEKTLQARLAQENRDRVMQELIAEGLAVGDGSLPSRELTEADRLRVEWRKNRANRESRDRGWTQNGHRGNSHTHSDVTTREPHRDAGDVRGRMPTKKKRKESTKEKHPRSARESAGIAVCPAGVSATAVALASNGTQTGGAAASKSSTRNTRNVDELRAREEPRRAASSGDLDERGELGNEIGHKRCNAALAYPAVRSESPRSHGAQSRSEPELSKPPRGSTTSASSASARHLKQIDNTRV